MNTAAATATAAANLIPLTLPRVLVAPASSRRPSTPVIPPPIPGIVESPEAQQTRARIAFHLTNIHRNLLPQETRSVARLEERLRDIDADLAQRRADTAGERAGTLSFQLLTIDRDLDELWSQRHALQDRRLGHLAELMAVLELANDDGWQGVDEAVQPLRRRLVRVAARLNQVDQAIARALSHVQRIGAGRAGTTAAAYDPRRQGAQHMLREQQIRTVEAARVDAAWSIGWARACMHAYTRIARDLLATAPTHRDAPMLVATLESRLETLLLTIV
ncbi:MAG: hypothetical protein AAF772_04740 [Acidobacteriota bacterium]